MAKIGQIVHRYKDSTYESVDKFYVPTIQKFGIRSTQELYDMKGELEYQSSRGKNYLCADTEKKLDELVHRMLKALEELGTT